MARPSTPRPQSPTAAPRSSDQRRGGGDVIGDPVAVGDPVGSHRAEQAVDGVLEAAGAGQRGLGREGRQQRRWPPGRVGPPPRAAATRHSSTSPTHSKGLVARRGAQQAARSGRPGSGRPAARARRRWPPARPPGRNGARIEVDEAALVALVRTTGRARGAGSTVKARLQLRKTRWYRSARRSAGPPTARSRGAAGRSTAGTGPSARRESAKAGPRSRALLDHWWLTERTLDHQGARPRPTTRWT